MTEKMVLGQTRYQILTARDGAEAVEVATRELPDLILMDLVMPKMNGLEACRKLRSQPATRDIPIIMVTTRGESDNVVKGFESGVTDYVTKPISGLELLTKVRSYLGR